MRGPEKVTVLVVEDDEAMRRRVVKLLRRAHFFDFVPVEADSLNSALMQLMNRQIDVALVDLTLPDSNPDITVETIARAKPNLPLMVLSGQEDLEVARACYRRGVLRFMLKSRLLPPPVGPNGGTVADESSAELEREIDAVLILHQVRAAEKAQERRSRIDIARTYAEVSLGPLHASENADARNARLSSIPPTPSVRFLEPYVLDMIRGMDELRALVRNNSPVLSERADILLDQMNYHIAQRNLLREIDCDGERPTISAGEAGIAILRGADPDEPQKGADPHSAAQAIAYLKRMGATDDGD